VLFALHGIVLKSIKDTNNQKEKNNTSATPCKQEAIRKILYITMSILSIATIISVILYFKSHNAIYKVIAILTISIDFFFLCIDNAILTKQKKKLKEELEEKQREIENLKSDANA
jgi:predicted secreted protein